MATRKWLEEHRTTCIDCGTSVDYRSIRCYSCDNKNKYKLGLKISWDGKFQKIATKKLLIDLYINQKKTIIEIAEIIGCKKSCVFNYLKKYNIKITNSKGACYKGIYMRSSWERSYAKYLDKNKIKWLYEPKLFNLGSCNYKPDFYLSETDTYIEIKGRWYKGAETKVNLFKNMYKTPLIVLRNKDLKQMGVL
jgi:hypothetical protein